MAEPKTKIPVEFKFEAEDEFDHPEGYFDSGDEELDKKTVAEICDKLDRGMLEAWFCAKVTCIGPEDFRGVAYLGGCSYNSFDEFKKDEYYAQMCAEAYDSMVAQMREAVKEGEEAKEILAKYGETE
jgi:hypothetical protein